MKWLIGSGIVAVSAVLVWGAFGEAVQAQEPYVELLSVFPPDADGVLFVDAGSLEDAGFFDGFVSAFITEQAAEHVPGKYEDFVEQTGFDPVRDIRHLMIGRSPEHGVLAVATADIDHSRIEAYFLASGFESRSVQRHSIYVPSSGGDWSFSFVDDAIVFGAHAAVTDAIGRVAGPGPSAAGSVPLRASIAGLDVAGSQIWGTGSLGGIPLLDDELGGIAPPMALDLVAALERVTYEMGFDTHVRARLHGEFSGPDMAMRAGDLLRGLVALGKMGSAEQPDMAELLNGFDVATAGNVVAIRFTATRELLDRIGRSGARLPGVE